ncbi:MAG: rRNA maturation RNase YbeY [Verrucomicrobia bacterium]|nr:rRNA maturation RNase YbeY [Verrucomicrobiota bacterium]
MSEYRRFAAAALEKIQKLSGWSEAPDPIAVVFVSDARMSRLHSTYMHIKGPTDVLTFQHGEIFVSVDTALRQAEEHKTSLAYELRLYIAHGILHLAGFDDLTPEGFKQMQQLQNWIVSETTPEPA